MPFHPWRLAFDSLRRGDLPALRRLPERSRLWTVADGLEPSLLHSIEDEMLSADALVGAPETRAGRLLLGTYSEAGIAYALKGYGIWDELRERVGAEPVVRIGGAGEQTQTLQLRAPEGGPVYVELRLALVPAPRPAGRPLSERSWVSIEWFNLQDPRRAFTAERPALPGQAHPGLGKGRQVMELLLILGWRIGAGGLTGHPAWFHNAVMYRVHFRFIDPVEEGRMLALLAAWERSGLSLHDASHALHGGRVRDAGGVEFAWRPGLMGAPLLRAAEFEDDAWKRQVAIAESEARFRFIDVEEQAAPPA